MRKHLFRKAYRISVTTSRVCSPGAVAHSLLPRLVWQRLCSGRVWPRTCGSLALVSIKGCSSALGWAGCRRFSFPSSSVLQRLNSSNVHPASPHGVEALYQAEDTGAPVVPCHASLLVGWRFNFRRVEIRSKTTAPTQHCVHKVKVSLWEQWATVLTPTPEPWVKFCQGEETGHKNRKLWGFPQRYWVYL